MIASFDEKDTPDLGAFPSAEAQFAAPVDAVPPKRGRKARLLSIVVRSLIVVTVFAALLLGGLFLLISSGPVSNDQLKAEVESQLSSLLGEGRFARIGEMSVVLGKSGLIALRARDVGVVGENSKNLGLARNVLVTVRALPLLSGKIAVKRVVVNKASLSLSPILQAVQGSQSSELSGNIDISSSLGSMGVFLDKVFEKVDDSGLDEFQLTDTKLVEFDQLGLRSREARIVSLKLEKDVNFQSGLFGGAIIEAQHANWRVDGAWRHLDNGTKALDLNVAGADLREFFPNVKPDEPRRVFADSPFTLKAKIPYSKDGSVQQAVASIDVGDGRLRLDEDYDTTLINGQFNFRIMPEKNQIELERSPVEMPTAKMVFIGGLRLPQGNEGSGAAGKPIFEIIANDIESRALIADAAPARAALRIDGWLDYKNKAVHADEISITSRTGKASGAGVFGFAGETPAIKLDLDLPKIAVNELKQLWHPVIAPKLRKWMADGVNGGTVENARVRMNVPSGILGNIKRGKRFADDHLVVSLSVKGASIKSFGDVPRITSASGKIEHVGMTSSARLTSGKVVMKQRREVQLSEGKIDFGDFSLPSIPARLGLKLKADASAAAELGQYKPLLFAEKINVAPKDVSGTITAQADVAFKLEDGGKISGLDWKADIKVKNFASKKEISGRKFSKANLSVLVDKEAAKISGTASIDGIAAKVAMVEQFDGGASVTKRTVSLVVDDAARRKLGIDTDVFMSGPVEVAVSEGKKGVQHIEANLTGATLSLPWIKWSKGKGIKANASFDLVVSKGVQRLENFQLRGVGFQALGKMTLDKRGLASASFVSVKLNKTDNLSINVDRSKGGYAIDLNARSYDARGIIQSFLQNDADDPAAKSKGTVVIKGKIARLLGFGGQMLTNVSLDYTQRNGRVLRAKVRAAAPGGARTSFEMIPSAKGQRTKMTSGNGGSVLRFLDLYSKVRGGNLVVNLVQGKPGQYVGGITASDFVLLDEPKLGQLMRPPRQSTDLEQDGVVEISKVAKFDPRKAKIRQMSANVSMGNKSLVVRKGRIQGGDAGASFEGTVYNRANKTNISGTFLPAYGLNRIVSKIPIIGLLAGNGGKRGLIGITFKLQGPYKNPDLIVNPVSVLAPGVFRKIFEF